MAGSRLRASLQIKREQVEDALRRIGKLDGFELEEIVPAVAQWRYRNKLEYSFGQDDDGGLVCGFPAPGGWKRVDPIEDCLLASERGNRAREVALRWARELDCARGTVTAERYSGRPLLRNLVVREGRHSGKLQVRLVTTDGELDVPSLAAALVAELGEETVSGVLWTRSSSLAETTMGGETELVWGEAELPERLGELDLRISSEASSRPTPRWRRRCMDRRRLCGAGGLGARL